MNQKFEKLPVLLNEFEFNSFVSQTYMSAPELCFRALDHKHERSDVKIVRNLVSHLQNGVLSRKERFGELF